MIKIGTLGAQKGSLGDQESEQIKGSAVLLATMNREYSDKRRATAKNKADRDRLAVHPAAGYRLRYRLRYRLGYRDPEKAGI
jgi:hypothetical protein